MFGDAYYINQSFVIFSLPSVEFGDVLCLFGESHCDVILSHVVHNKDGVTIWVPYISKSANYLILKL